MPAIERRVSPAGIVRHWAWTRLHGTRTASRTIRRNTDARKGAQKTEVAIRPDPDEPSPISRRRFSSVALNHRHVASAAPGHGSRRYRQDRYLTFIGLDDIFYLSLMPISVQT